MFDKTVLTRFGQTPEAAKAALERELTAFAALPASLQEVWLRPRPEGAWSPAETTEHVLKINVSMSKVLNLLRTDKPLPEQVRTPGRLKEDKAQAPEFTRPGPPQAWDALEPQWLEVAARLRREVDETHDWRGRSWFHPYFGDLDALGWLASASLHMAHHRKQLRPDEA